MAIVRQASGTFTATGFSPTLPAASSASNCVVLVIAGNTTVTTPASWTLRDSQVNFMGHYIYDRAGVSLTSVTITSAAGQGTWWIAEIASGAYQSSLSANNTAAGTTYNTPSLTPTAGTREVLASIASTAFSAGTARTVSGWTSSFIEQADVCEVTADSPMQGIASLDDLAAGGATAYTTTATYSANSVGRSAIIASYVTAGGAAPAVMPNRHNVTANAVRRASLY
jgi:hypothetical protein